MNWKRPFGVTLKLSLPAYDVVANGDDLEVSLFWQAQKPVDLSYKVFLHVIDSSTNELVAQMDFIPDNWIYPTNYWQCGEIVHDQVSLPIENLSPGQYSLLLGMYEEGSGARFPVSRINGQDVSEQIVHLATLRR